MNKRSKLVKFYKAFRLKKLKGYKFIDQTKGYYIVRQGRIQDGGDTVSVLFTRSSQKKFFTRGEPFLSIGKLKITNTI